MSAHRARCFNTLYYEYTFVVYLGVIKELLHRKMCMAAPGARCYDDFLLLYYENSVHVLDTADRESMHVSPR